MKIQIGKRARLQIERVSDWWPENRPSAPFLFEQELDEAVRLLRSTPKAGVPYPTTKRATLRRLLLPKTQYHLYFTLEQNETALVIHALWGARRGRGPTL